jgi:DNA-binding response OmpR family regulator
MTSESPEVSRLLIVDDDPMVGRILEHKLRREGWAVTWVRDLDSALGFGERVGEVAVALLGSCAALAPDELARRLGLSRDPSGDHAPPPWLAIVDGRAVGLQERAIAVGARGIVAKPFKPSQVAAQVAALTTTTEDRAPEGTR